MPSRSTVPAALVLIALTATGCSAEERPAAAEHAVQATKPPQTASPTSPRPTPSPRSTPIAKKPLPSTPSPTIAVRPIGKLGGCPNLPSDDVWHADVSKLPLLARSSGYVASIGAGGSVKADFGAGLWDGGPIGIPITYVDGNQRKVKVSAEYADESDPGPYPIPADAKVEGGAQSDGDRHVLVVDKSSCKLYELWNAHRQPDGSWQAGSAAIFDLRSSRLRPKSWTSADAAGLPVAPGLVRYDEVAAGHVDHAIRMTVPKSQLAYLWPARHAASSSSDKSLPPMGLRLRLKAGTDISHLPKQARVIAQAMKRYGVMVADNGSAWYLSGTPDPRWNNDALQALSQLHGTNFEAVDTSSLMTDPNSGQALSAG